MLLSHPASSPATLLPARALLRADGSVEQLDDARGAQVLEQIPEIARYARALAFTERSRLAFTWPRRRDPWILVRASWSAPGAGDLPTVTVELDLQDGPPFALTQRELDILTLLAGGFSNPEISERLFASRGTISTHVERVLSKLGQRSRAGAAAVALEQGLLRLPIPGGAAGFEHLAVGAVEALAGCDQAPARSGASNVVGLRRARPLLVGLLAALPEQVGDRDEQINGVDMAIEEINARGGIGGRSLERITVDVAIDDPASIRAGLGDLVAADVDVITMGYLWAEDPSIYAVTCDYGCPILTSATSEAQARWVSDDPESLGRVFQVSSTERSYGSGFFRLLGELERTGEWRPPNRRTVCIQTPVAAGQFLNDEAIALATALGWEIEAVFDVANLDADWSEALAAIRASSPAAVQVAHFMPSETARFQRQFMDDPRDTLLHYVYTPSVPAYQDEAGATAEGVLWTTSTGTYGDAIGRTFAAGYQQRFGRPPGRSMAGIGYDQVQIVAGAWARAGNPRAFDRVAAELRSTVHRGVSGVYAMGNERQTSLSYPEETSDPSIGQAALSFQIQDGSNRILGPAPYSETTFRVPPWFAHLTL